METRPTYTVQDELARLVDMIDETIAAIPTTPEQLDAQYRGELRELREALAAEVKLNQALMDQVERLQEHIRDLEE